MYTLYLLLQIVNFVFQGSGLKIRIFLTETLISLQNFITAYYRVEFWEKYTRFIEFKFDLYCTRASQNLFTFFPEAIYLLISTKEIKLLFDHSSLGVRCKSLGKSNQENDLAKEEMHRFLHLLECRPPSSSFRGPNRWKADGAKSWLHGGCSMTSNFICCSALRVRAAEWSRALLWSKNTPLDEDPCTAILSFDLLLSNLPSNSDQARVLGNPRTPSIIFLSWRLHFKIHGYSRIERFHVMVLCFVACFQADSSVSTFRFQWQ